MAGKEKMDNYHILLTLRKLAALVCVIKTVSATDKKIILCEVLNAICCYTDMTDTVTTCLENLEKGKRQGI